MHIYISVIKYKNSNPELKIFMQNNIDVSFMVIKQFLLPPKKQIVRVYMVFSIFSP